MKDRELLEKLNDYIAMHDTELAVPFLKEFCYLYDLDAEKVKRRGKENKKIREALRKLDYQREHLLQQGMINKTLDRSACVFALKQMGWRESVEVEKSVKIDFKGDVAKWGK